MSNPSSNKGWHDEFMKFSGGDLGFLPEYHRPDGIVYGVKRLEHLMEFEEEEARRFARGIESGLWTDNEFMDPEFLFNHNSMGECFCFYLIASLIYIVCFHTTHVYLFVMSLFIC